MESETQGAQPPKTQSGKISLLGLDAEQMRAVVGPLSELPPFRSRQVARWLYVKGETQFSAMTNIARPLREVLEAAYTLEPDPVLSLQRAESDEAWKFLFRLHDGGRVESVLINTAKRRTICISSQAGCAYACAFCATAAMGPGRNLTSRELVSQVLTVRRQMRLEGMAGGHNLVFMGMGEPLANLLQLVPALRLLQNDEGLSVGRRRITVSTVGLVPQILQLAETDVKCRLAFSLNATTDETRTRLMPVNEKYPFRQVFEALRTYQQKKRMRVSLEYVLLAGINDTPEDARRLAEFARETRFKVNLIAYNAHPAAPFQPTPDREIARFVESMYPIAPSVTLRYSKGRDILAACGQLSTVWSERESGGASEDKKSREARTRCEERP